MRSLALLLLALLSFGVASIVDDVEIPILIGRGEATVYTGHLSNDKIPTCDFKSRLAQLDMTMSFPAAVFVSDSIFVCGGNNKYCNDFFFDDRGEGKLSRLDYIKDSPAANSGLSDVQLATWNDDFAVFGGILGDPSSPPSQYTYRYHVSDQTSQGWTYYKAEPRTENCLVRLEDSRMSKGSFLYVSIGGYVGESKATCEKKKNCIQVFVCTGDCDDMENGWEWKDVTSSQINSVGNGDVEVHRASCTEIIKPETDGKQYPGILVYGGISNYNSKFVEQTFIIMLRDWTSDGKPLFNIYNQGKAVIPPIQSARLVTVPAEDDTRIPRQLLLGGRLNSDQDNFDVYEFVAGQQDGTWSKLTQQLLSNANADYIDSAAVVVPGSWLCSSGSSSSTQFTPTKSSSTTLKPTTATCPSDGECRATDARGLDWAANFGDVAEKPCPANYDGVATWKCSGCTGTFVGSQPDRSQCVAEWISDVDEMLEDPAADSLDISRVIRDNVNNDGDSQGLPGGTIVQLASTVNQLIVRILNERRMTKDTRKQDEEAEEVAANIANATNNLVAELTGWKEIPTEITRYQTTTEHLRNLDQIGNILADQYLTTTKRLGSACQSEFRSSHSALQLQVNLVDRNTAQDGQHCITFDNVEARACIEVNTFHEMNSNCSTVVGTLIRTKEENQPEDESLFFTNQLESGDPMEESTARNRVNVLGLHVVGVTVNNGSQPVFADTGLVPITVTYPNILYEDVVGCSYLTKPAVCTYWDELTSSWSSEGCTSNSKSDESSIVCKCRHLTNFGIILDWRGDAVASDPALDGISTFLMVMSCICIVITEIILFMQKKDNRGFIRKTAETNRNLNLFLAQVGWLAFVGLQGIVPCTVCQIFAAIVHFLWIAMFTWTVLEGYFFYRALVTVFNADRGSVIRFYLVGYGVAILTVGVTLAVSFATDSTLYLKRTDDDLVTACWLYGNGIFAVVVPAGIMVVFNSVITVIAVWIAHRAGIRRNLPRPRRVATSLRNTLLLTLLLGITWVLGFLPASLPQQYIFIVLNASSGAYILMYSVISNRQVRGEVSERFTNLMSRSTETKTSV